MAKRQLITSDEATDCNRQHKKPCSDCPFARTALRGWLGNSSAEDWVKMAHGDQERIGDSTGLCHTRTGNDIQCAGLAIYRANICKSPSDPTALRLKANKTLVFASSMEFLEHRTHDNLD